MKLNRHILCIDAGFRNLGVAVYSSTFKYFVFVDCYSTEKDSSISVAEDCLNTIKGQARYLNAIMDRYPISFVVAELPTGASRSSRAVRAMAMAFATIVTFCASRNVRLIPVKPSSIKRLVSKGAVSKEAVQKFVTERYGSTLLDSIKRSKREHVADAIACLVVHQNEGIASHVRRP